MITDDDDKAVPFSSTPSIEGKYSSFLRIVNMIVKLCVRSSSLATAAAIPTHSASAMTSKNPKKLTISTRKTSPGSLVKPAGKCKDNSAAS